MIPRYTFPAMGAIWSDTHRLSVMLQVAYFNLSGGKRLFRMTPLHHHFEAKGWPRYRIVMRYWIVSYMCALLGIVIKLIS